MSSSSLNKAKTGLFIDVGWYPLARISQKWLFFKSAWSLSTALVREVLVL